MKPDPQLQMEGLGSFCGTCRPGTGLSSAVKGSRPPLGREPSRAASSWDWRACTAALGALGRVLPILFTGRHARSGHFHVIQDAVQTKSTKREVACSSGRKQGSAGHLPPSQSQLRPGPGWGQEGRSRPESWASTATVDSSQRGSPLVPSVKVPAGPVQRVCLGSASGTL